MPTNNKHSQKLDFLIEAYRARIQLHSEHTNRLWTRFNFLLTADIALLGIFVNFWSDTNGQGLYWPFPLLGSIVSLLWYVLGAQDHYYFEGFRRQVRSLEQKIGEEEFETSVPKEFPFGHVDGVGENWVTWRREAISLSKLVAIFPLFFLLVWIVSFLLTRL